VAQALGDGEVAGDDGAVAPDELRRLDAVLLREAVPLEVDLLPRLEVVAVAPVDPPGGEARARGAEAAVAVEDEQAPLAPGCHVHAVQSVTRVAPWRA
jgi:hypothetical protein